LQVVIPISDDNPTRTAAVVNWAIMLVCVAAFIWEISLGRHMDAAIMTLGFTPDALTSPAHHLSGYITVPGFATIFTSMFLHGGWLHIAGNMLYLWIFGNNIEDAMGHVRYLLFYLLCGVVAALSMAFVDPHSQIPMVGASGAISGVLAAYMLLFPRARVTVIVPLGIIFYPLVISAIWVIGFWFVLQLISAAFTSIGQPGVAFWAHVGGFAVGLVLTPLFKSSQFRLFGDVRRGPWG
jgi:membrane associated rhomboid family serine protease